MHFQHTILMSHVTHLPHVLWKFDEAVKPLRPWVKSFEGSTYIPQPGVPWQVDFGEVFFWFIYDLYRKMQNLEFRQMNIFRYTSLDFKTSSPSCHYLKQSWSSCLTHICVTWPQWVFVDYERKFSWDFYFRQNRNRRYGSRLYKFNVSLLKKML